MADVTLFLATGRVSGSVWSHVRDRDPVFTWIEPRPDAVTALAGRRADVTGVYAGLPDLGGLPVEEMRLHKEPEKKSKPPVSDPEEPKDRPL